MANETQSPSSPTVELNRNYFLKFQVGEDVVPLSPTGIKRFTVVHDLFSFLPEVRIMLADPNGVLTHLLPFDRSVTRTVIEYSRSRTELDVYNNMQVDLWRNMSQSEFSISSIFDVSGLMHTNDFFSNDKSRGFNQSAYLTLAQLASEIGCDSLEISPSLNYEKLIVQPQWTNRQLLLDLVSRIGGANNEGGFVCYLKRKTGRTAFVFKSLSELAVQPISHKFVANTEPYDDYFPILAHRIFNNYRLLAPYGVRSQKYTYFDFDSGTFVPADIGPSNYVPLSNHYMADFEDPATSISRHFGTNNQFTKNFLDSAQALFHRRLTNLVKMWFTTWGLPNLCPGDIINILYGRPPDKTALGSYQYGGKWMVERVVHNFGETFKTSVLVTRSGLDVPIESSLVPV